MGDSAGFELLFSPKWWVAMIHPYICCGCVSFRVLPVLPIFMVINLHGFSPVQCTATFTDESVGCIMKPEFAPHLTRGQHICCSWLSKHCHCGARQKENVPRFSSFFSGCLGWWVRKHWEWLRITETTVDTWNISVFLPCSSDGSVLGPPWIWVIGIRQNMSHQDCFQWNLSRLMIIPSLTLWQRLFPGHKHHWTQYWQINYFLISDWRVTKRLSSCELLEWWPPDLDDYLFLATPDRGPVLAKTAPTSAHTHSETVAVRSWLPRVFCGEWKSLKINIGRNYSFVRSSRIVCRLPGIFRWNLSLLKIYMWSKFLAAQVSTFNACELRRFFFLTRVSKPKGSTTRMGQRPSTPQVDLPQLHPIDGYAWNLKYEYGFLLGAPF